MSQPRSLGDLDAIRAEARTILQNLSDTQLNESPAKDRWSVGQCFNHMIVAGTVELPHTEEAIREGRKQQVLGSEPFRYGLIESWVVRKMDVQTRMKFKAPKIYAPTSEQFTGPKLLSDFLALQDRWESCFKDAAGLDLQKIRVVTPVTRFITLSLGKTFELFLAHERRHLQQARLTLSR
jgi:hypothetical protein